VAIVWPLQEAKNRLSEVIERAARFGPQVVTRHGKRVAVIVSAREYDRMRGGVRSLWRYLRTAPTKGVRLRIERDRSPGRAVEL
jgi:prevent-host-death family protein